MTWKELTIGEIYVSDFTYNYKPATIIIQHNGSTGCNRRKHVDALGKYEEGNCCGKDCTFRLPTQEEKQQLLKHLNVMYEIY